MVDAEAKMNKIFLLSRSTGKTYIFISLPMPLTILHASVTLCEHEQSASKHLGLELLEEFLP